MGKWADAARAIRATYANDKSDKSDKSPGTSAQEPPSDDATAKPAPNLVQFDHVSEWQGFYDERAAIREFASEYPRADAEALAWAELINEWHFQHAAYDPERCAGCFGSFDGEPMILPDGARVHSRGLDCLLAYGKKWRAKSENDVLSLGVKRKV